MDNLSRDIMTMLESLGAFGQDPAGGITRFLYSKEWRDAQEYLHREMASVGLETHYDAVGNLYGRLHGSKYPNDTILSGSHVDTVANAGYYDGQFGIVAALVAVKYLKETYGTPLRNLEVISLAEEEGSRFPYAFWGSKNLVGSAKNVEVEAIRDNSGVLFVDAMRECGFDFRDERQGIRQDLKAFVEVHIEQGSVLETEQKSLGIVTSIVGQRRFTIELIGQANHAGTTPMGYRKDAAYAASQMIYEVISEATKYGDPLVATVGHIEMKPNVVNVVPGHAVFTLDTRHTNKDVLIQFTEFVTARFQEIAELHGVDIHIDMWMDEDPVPMSRRVIDVIENSCKTLNLNYKLMHSGAGHDAQILAPVIPTALLFVPSARGISHNPEEYTKPEHLVEGVKALIGTLYQLAYEE